MSRAWRPFEIVIRTEDRAELQAYHHIRGDFMRKACNGRGSVTGLIKCCCEMLQRDVFSGTLKRLPLRNGHYRMAVTSLGARYHGPSLYISLILIAPSPTTLPPYGFCVRAVHGTMKEGSRPSFLRACSVSCSVYDSAPLSPVLNLDTCHIYA